MNLVYAEDGHILQRFGDALAKHNGWSAGPPKAEPGNFYLPYYLFTGQEPSGWDVCFFTHKDTDNPRKEVMFDMAAESCDVCIAMSNITSRQCPR